MNGKRGETVQWPMLWELRAQQNVIDEENDVETYTLGTIVGRRVLKSNLVWYKYGVQVHEWKCISILFFSKLPDHIRWGSNNRFTVWCTIAPS